MAHSPPSGGKAAMAGEADLRHEAPDDARSNSPISWLKGRKATTESLLATVGLTAFLGGTLPGLWPGAYRALTIVCVAVALVFLIQYILQLRRQEKPLEWMVTGPAIIDLLAVLPIPLALLFGADSEVARLFGVLWSLKLLRMNAAFVLLGRVLSNERQSLMSVTTAFFVVVLFAATLAFVLERKEQPEAFGSVPAALWWAVTTITTTGYGDKIPVTFAGRTLAGIVMVAGIGLFALWAGILASGFAHELRRREFLESWDVVVRLPLFRNLGAPALAEVARLLKVQNCSRGAPVVRQGQPGDSMFFIADGEVEVHAGAARIHLRSGQFFGEMALISGAPRNATVVAVAPTRLLRLDVVDFRELAARQPELLQMIEAENARRTAPPAR
jgi:voltage-gated potassium channel